MVDSTRKGKKDVFYKNSIIRFTKSENGVETFQDLRILVKGPQVCGMINIADSIIADAFYLETQEIIEVIENGKGIILNYDPVINELFVDESSLTDSQIKRYEFYVELMHYLLYKDGALNLDIFDAKLRAKLVSNGVKKAKEMGEELCPKTIRRKIRHFLRFGMVDKCLYPQYDLRGGTGQRHNSMDKKIGRLSAHEKLNGRPRPLYDLESLRIIFYKELEKHYSGENSLQYVLDRVVEDYFTTGVELRNGEPKYTYVDDRLFPTYPQLYNFYKTEWRKDPIKFLKKKYGERIFNKDLHPKTGRLLNKAFGPGLLYMGDSAVGDIYLVHSFDRKKIIGRPNIYPILDDFSGLVAGIAVTNENPNWMPFLLALDNCNRDKVEYCAEYGIRISKSMWPSEGFPAAIKLDRAEGISRVSTKLNNLQIRIENTASYRPDWKGLVEKWIHLMNLEAQRLPGGITHPHKRGENDVRLLACLTPEEFIKAIIHFVIFYNNHHIIKGYPRTTGMIEDKVKCTPSNIWAWGIENMTGDLRYWDREDAMLNLLPDGIASYTEDNGFLFKGKNFLSGLPEEKVMSVIAQQEGRSSYKVVYDPRRPDTLYCQLKERQRLTPLYLTEKFKPFRGLHEMEWDIQSILDRITSTQDNLDEQKERINKDLVTKTIVEPAYEDAMAARKGMTKTEQTAGMQENRAMEKEVERGKTPLLPSDNMVADKPSMQNNQVVPQESTSKNSGYVPKPKQTQALLDLEDELAGDDP